MSALGDGKGNFDEVRAVEEIRIVGRDPVWDILPLRDIVWGGGSNGIRGDGECREESRRIGWRGG